MSTDLPTAPEAICIGSPIATEMKIRLEMLRLGLDRDHPAYAAFEGAAALLEAISAAWQFAVLGETNKRTEAILLDLVDELMAVARYEMEQSFTEAHWREYERHQDLLERVMATGTWRRDAPHLDGIVNDNGSAPAPNLELVEREAE